VVHRGDAPDRLEEPPAREDPVAVRVGRLEESLKVVKGLLAGGPLAFTGAHYSVSGLEGFPPPVQRPHPPILVGAGSRRMLGIAGREADIVGILPRALPDGTISEALSERSSAMVAEKVGWVREAAGDRFDRVELSMVATVRVAGDHVAAAERLAAEEGWGGGAAERVLEMPSVFLGPVERIVDQLRERRERYGFSYYVVPDGAMEAVAPVVERLAGR
jgi:alkanesulfonate monooxygenase SsuD/methylene tetrahydromethanopterin reductase-like flavin-dependent oxidoreductase (luciferase family)